MERIMRYFFLLLWLLAASSLVNYAPVYLVDASTQGGVVTQEADRPARVKVDTGMIEKLPISKQLIPRIRQLPYVSNEPVERNDWHIRLRPGVPNGSQIVIEREGGAVMAKLATSDLKLFDKVAAALEREGEWRIIRSLENNSRGSTIRIELRVVPVMFKRDARGNQQGISDIGNPKTQGHLSEGDLFLFEVRNLGTSDAYVSILDLTSDGVTKLLFPSVDEPTIKNRISPNGAWHRIPSPYLYRITPPYGLEVFKAIATREPLDLQAFETRNRIDEGPLDKLLRGATISQANPFGTVDWGTAALTFQVGPTKNEPVAVTETDTPKTTLHILAVGINHYEGIKPSPDLAFAVKDAKDITAALERVGRSRFREINSKLILDSQATRESITRGFDEIIARAGPQDTFVFFYSGQGTAFSADRKTAPQMLLLPADFFSKGPRPSDEELAEKGISAGQLHSWLRRIQSRHQLLVLDTDESGQGFETFISSLNEENRSLEGLLQRDLVILGNAGVSYETSDKQNGLLTYAVMGGLQDAGEVTARSLLLSTTRIAERERRYITLKTYAVGGDFSLGFAAQERPTTREHHWRRLSTVVDAQQEPPKKRSEMVPTAESSQPATYSRRGKDYALLIATSDYDHKEAWPHLDNPVRDAKAIAHLLEHYYGFETEILENPTRDDIVTSLKTYKRKYDDDDQLFIFFAGHGKFFEDTKEGFIIARDSGPPDNEKLSCERCLSFYSLSNLINFLPCKHIFLVLDTCFSGTFEQKIARQKFVPYEPDCEATLNPEPDDPLEEELRKAERHKEIAIAFRLPPSSEKFIETTIQVIPTRRFLTSGFKHYVCDGLTGRHSPFARRLLRGFVSFGGDKGYLTVHKLFDYAEDLRPYLGEWSDHEQGADFLFITKHAAPNSP